MPKKKLPQTIEECNAELDDDSEINIRPEDIEMQVCRSSGKRVQHIHIKYDGLGFIPLNELLKQETA